VVIACAPRTAAEVAVSPLCLSPFRVLLCLSCCSPVLEVNERRRLSNVCVKHRRHGTLTRHSPAQLEDASTAGNAPIAMPSPIRTNRPRGDLKMCHRPGGDGSPSLVSSYSTFRTFCRKRLYHTWGQKLSFSPHTKRPDTGAFSTRGLVLDFLADASMEMSLF
jgi:hypothetical protein